MVDMAKIMRAGGCILLLLGWDFALPAHAGDYPGETWAQQFACARVRPAQVCPAGQRPYSRLAQTETSSKCVARTATCTMPYPAPVGTPCICQTPAGPDPGIISR